MDFLGDEGRWWGKNGAILVNHDELCIKTQKACIKMYQCFLGICSTH